LLVPLSWIYAVLLRRYQRRALARSELLDVPVIVVGNLTVGGTGKTPVVIWLIEQLTQLGYRPGIVTRGYGGTETDPPLLVGPASSALEAGDEAVMLARRLGCPVVAGRNRVLAAHRLIESGGVDVVVSDDGLQHFSLRRDCEIVVVDGGRGMGNGRLLPAGPLREPENRLGQADIVLVNGAGWTSPDAHHFELQCATVVQVADGRRRSLAHFSGRTVHAHAAIGNPQRFFAMLAAAGCVVEEHAWPDHAHIPMENLRCAADPVLITEKDAVKLPRPAPAGIWVVNVDLDMARSSAAAVLQRVAERIRRSETSE
jgi:tetraacyldisaccharide 4'-kinase